MSLITNLIDKITELVKLKLDQVKIEVKGQVGVLLSRLVIIFAIGLLVTFALFFLGLAVAFVLNDVIGNNYGGFLVVGGIALLGSFILYRVASSEGFTKAIKSRLLDNDD
ncbi:MAG: phage holin family protein [Cytophagales bacterium]|nr:phage holin family protein [Cytophagales bacterium]